jgi:hypothetical protein
VTEAALIPPVLEGEQDRSRYQFVEKEEQRLLVCTSAPNIKLYVERGLTITSSTRKRYPRQSIFLDGVFNDAPFLDNENRQYSFDHHAGCVRAFTLATCEQAVVMLLQGLPLDEGEWHVYVNEPDLDSLLAAWVLLNHAELRKDDNALLHRAMPIIRVEGVIDAHGLERSVLTGLPAELYEKYRGMIDELSADERKLKASGDWASTDLVAYTNQALSSIDRMVFPQEQLDELLSTELIELGRAVIQHRKIALLVRSARGIYAVESDLKARYERQLGVIILEQSGRRFTVRQVDPFLTRNLGHLYELLNEEDGEVAEDNTWGGSTDIGGSPRKNGSALDGEQILELVADCYAERGVFARAWRATARKWRRWRAARASEQRALVKQERTPWWKRFSFWS